MKTKLEPLLCTALLVFVLAATAWITAAPPTGFSKASLADRSTANVALNTLTGAMLTNADSYATFGTGTLSFTGTGTATLNLSGTAATSVPCATLVLSCTSAGCLVSSASTGGGVPLPANQFLKLPVSNVNAVWVTGGTTNSVGYGYFR